MEIDFFSVTAPKTVRLPSGETRLMAEVFKHPDGILYFDLWWHQENPDTHFHIIKGEVTGDGPWKINGHVINVLGCQGTVPELSSEWSAWDSYIMSHISDYPVPDLVKAIARKMGAEV